jgi:hypothetical protein
MIHIARFRAAPLDGASLNSRAIAIPAAAPAPMMQTSVSTIVPVGTARVDDHMGMPSGEDSAFIALFQSHRVAAGQRSFYINALSINSITE